MSEDLLSRVEFTANPEPRCPVVLLLDTSGSMSGQPIAELNAGLKELESDLKADPLAALRVELAVVPFGGRPQAIDVRANPATPFDAGEPFASVDAFQAPMLTTSGSTPMCAALRLAVDLLRRRKDTYKANAIDYYRPWILLITDGEPTDGYGLPDAIDLIQQEETHKAAVFYAIGTEKANFATLASLSTQRPPIKLQGLQFRELFNWLSKSLQQVSASKMGQQVSLAPIGWGTLDTSTP
jgi:uncharacterized protein YegL